MPGSGGPGHGVTAPFTAYHQEEDASLSGKTMVVLKVAAMVKARQERLIVASISTATLEFMGCLLKKDGFICHELTGETLMSDRGRIVTELNDPSSKGHVLLLSIKAGGTGLNLTGANNLVLVEPSLNPCADEQAIARIYRPGQWKDVFIYRLVAGDTRAIEMQVMMLQVSHKTQ